MKPPESPPPSSEPDRSATDAPPARRYADAEAGNRRHWDELAPVHVESYVIDPLLSGRPVVDEIQIAEMGPVAGKSLLHLQCHIGTDTLSWGLLGARPTGIDISPVSLEHARELARKTGAEARFIESSLYDLPAKLEERFDIVYTSVGVLCWLSDLSAWARLIRSYLKPDGFFYIMETHPVLMVFDDEVPETRLRYPYFHRPEPVCWAGQNPDYADPGYLVKEPSYEWQWSLSDILNALLDAGLRIEFLREHDRLHYPALPGMIQEGRWWRLPPETHGCLPLAFSLKARPGIAK